MESRGPHHAESAVPANVRRAFYCAHALSTWGDRTWQFAAALLLIDVWTDSLLAVAAYGLVTDLANTVIGPHVGDWLDRMHRLSAMRVVLAVENGGIALCASLLTYLLWTGRQVAFGDHTGVALMVGVLICGAIADVAQSGEKVALEKDWVVVLARGDKDELAAMNSTMKLIDLVCKISAPTAAGLIITFASSTAAAIYVGAAALLFVSAEYVVLRWVYARVPELAKDSAPGRELGKQEKGGAGAVHGGYGALEEDAEEAKAAPAVDGEQEGKAPTARRGTLAQLACYFSQTAAPAALALAVIYFTVLDFGSLMTAYLKLRGLDAAYLGAARGAGAIFGVVASVTFPFFRRCMELKPSALVGIWLQLICISPSLAVLIWPFHDTAHRTLIASWLLIAGVITSRFALWLFDLSVSQIMQETVPERERGVVGGVQSSLQHAFQLVMYVLGVIFHHSDEFEYLIGLSVLVIGAAALLYTLAYPRIRLSL